MGRGLDGLFTSYEATSVTAHHGLVMDQHPFEYLDDLPSDKDLKSRCVSF